MIGHSEASSVRDGRMLKRCFCAMIRGFGVTPCRCNAWALWVFIFCTLIFLRSLDFRASERVFCATHFFPITCSTMDMSNDRSSIRIYRSEGSKTWRSSRASAPLVFVTLSRFQLEHMLRSGTQSLGAARFDYQTCRHRIPGPHPRHIWLVPIVRSASCLLTNWRGDIHLESTLGHMVAVETLDVHPLVFPSSLFFSLPYLHSLQQNWILRGPTNQPTNLLTDNVLESR